MATATLLGTDEYLNIDPKTRTGRMCTGAEWVRAQRLVVAGTPIYVELEELFSRLQRQADNA